MAETTTNMVCKGCGTKREMKYQCRNLPSIGFFEGWQCPNCKLRVFESIRGLKFEHNGQRCRWFE